MKRSDILKRRQIRKYNINQPITEERHERNIPHIIENDMDVITDDVHDHHDKDIEGGSISQILQDDIDIVGNNDINDNDNIVDSIVLSKEVETAPPVLPISNKKNLIAKTPKNNVAVSDNTEELVKMTSQDADNVNALLDNMLNGVITGKLKRIDIDKNKKKIDKDITKLQENIKNAQAILEKVKNI